METFKEFLLAFMPEKCYHQFFLYFNIMHVPCLKIILSKTVGMLIFMGIVIAPLPQIWKVLWSGSSNGLCLSSVFMELLAISTHTALCYSQNFPIGAWGESLFASIQIAVLAFLVQHYRGKTIKGLCSLALYCGMMVFLVSPLTPVAVVWTMNEWNVLLVIVGRFSQASSIFICGHTGQLSALSVFLVFLGSLGHVFGSLQSTGLSVSTQAQALACCCSGVILTQVLIYWNKCKKDKAD